MKAVNKYKLPILKRITMSLSWLFLKFHKSLVRDKFLIENESGWWIRCDQCYTVFRWSDEKRITDGVADPKENMFMLFGNRCPNCGKLKTLFGEE